MGLAATAQIHYLYFSKSQSPKIQVWPLSYLKPISRFPLFSGSKEQNLKMQLCIKKKKYKGGEMDRAFKA